MECWLRLHKAVGDACDREKTCFLCGQHSRSIPAMKRQLLLLIPLTAMLTAAKAPPYLRDPAQNTSHPDYPEKTHICGLGLSASSSTKALQNARAEVSRQIRSQLQGEFEAVESMKTSKRKVTTSQEFTQRVVEKYSFRHSALIKSVASLEPKRKQKEHAAFACLNRSDAAAAILTELDPARKRLVNAARLAAEANTKRDVAGFAVQFTMAQRAWGEIWSQYIELRIINQPRAFDLEVDLKKLDSLRSVAAQWRKNQRISVVIDASAGSQARLVQGKVQQALQSIGLEATGSGKSCSRSEGSTHVLKVTPSHNCQEGVFLVCQLDFDVRMKECRSGDEVGGKIEDDDFKAIDNQFDEKKAKARTWAKVSSDKLAPGLKTVVGTQLPME